jgi:hypothetical protein
MPSHPASAWQFASRSRRSLSNPAGAGGRAAEPERRVPGRAFCSLFRAPSRAIRRQRRDRSTIAPDGGSVLPIRRKIQSRTCTCHPGYWRRPTPPKRSDRRAGNSNIQCRLASVQPRLDRLKRRGFIAGFDPFGGFQPRAGGFNEGLLMRGIVGRRPAKALQRELAAYTNMLHRTGPTW